MNTVSDPDVQIAELRLIRQAAAGEPQARRALFERYRDEAYRVALRITGRPADALDVVQDAFIRAFGSLADFRGQARFRTWLLRIVANRARDLLRSRRVRKAVSLDADDETQMPQIAGDDPPPGKTLEQQELAERIRAAVQQLPEAQRVVFALYASGQMTYGQIAETLGIPVGTVMSRLYHARRRLAELLADLAPPGRAEEP